MDQITQRPPERPSGETPMALGWVLIVIGAIAIFVAGSGRSFEGTILGYLIAQLGIGLGVLLVSLGYIVRAIWFLPGREIPIAVPQGSAAERVECDWCGQSVAAPHKPCALVDREKLAAVAPTIQNSRCREALAAQGFDVGA